MPIDSTSLLKGLKQLLKTLDADLLKRVKDTGVDQGLRTAWQQEKADGRTGAAFPLWRRHRCSQVSIAWVLSVVFVRTLEDRGFLTRRRIAGPVAEDSEKQLTALAPFLTPRDYLLTVFRELAQLPGAAELFDAQHNPVWVLAPSAEGARQLLDFFRQTDAEGELVYCFEGTDTRFLGDLYQNLSDDVRKRYALLQTPEFVEEFILEQTLDPAVRAFGLAEVRLIDPTCGSGHFLLGAFHRLFDAWQGEAPGEDRQVLAQRTLQQVYGCDLNPYAVAIARFRLTLEFLQVTGIERLEQAPRLPLNLCVADSLLHGVSGEQQRLASGLEGEERGKWEAWGDQLFALEDEREALRILKQRYHAVVGNPPYKTEKDAKKREKYRSLYVSAAGKFALAAPFTERLFGLAVPAGFVGMINANSFTKRDFGKALIEQVLPELDVQKVVDTSGAYIPGHGTPTLLLFGRNQSATTSPVVAVLGKRGEAEEPLVPTSAPVWSEIVDHHGEVGFDGRYVSVEQIPRSEMGEHPWVLAGGGARSLKTSIESSPSALRDIAIVGVFGMTNADDCMRVHSGDSERHGIEGKFVRSLYVGEAIRDWRTDESSSVVYPYKWPADLIPENSSPGLFRYLWPFRTILWARATFGGGTYRSEGLPWWRWHQVASDRLETPLSITFAFVATHNHFVLDRGGKVFKQSAPIIKLKDEHTEDDHLALLGLLNSSTVAFWCRLVMFQKGGDQVGDGARVSPAPWDRHLEYAGNLLKLLPLPPLDQATKVLLPLVQEAERIVKEMGNLEPGKTLQDSLRSAAVASSDLLTLQRSTISELEHLRRRLVSIQEEIDWRTYSLFGLPTLAADSLEEVLVSARPEHRPFEVRLARDLDDDLSARIWFERHRREPPTDVGGPLAELYRRRLQLIDETKELQLLETPETKRRWPPRDLEKDFQEAYRDWLQDRLESLLSNGTQPATQSARQLAAELHRDPKAQAVAEVYTGETAPDLERLVSDLLRGDGVPYLAAHRYSTTGLEKHAVWRETWDKQRQEDAGEKVGKIDVPPKYATKDFRRPSYWTHRGKLDVPKERFVLYPNAETDGDDTPLAGWAGWDHLQRATALSALYQSRKTDEGWEAERLTPLLAGLHELVSWLIQWHNEPDPAFGGQRLGHFFRDFVAGEARSFGLSTADLEAWRPPQARRGKKKTRPSVTSEALLDTLATLGVETAGEVTQADLASALGVASAVVGKVAKALVESGELEVTRGRPKTYRAATILGDLFDNSAEGTS